MAPLYFSTIAACCLCPVLGSGATLLAPRAEEAFEQKFLVFPISKASFTSLNEIKSLKDLPHPKGPFLIDYGPFSDSGSMPILGPSPSKKHSQWISSIMRSQELLSTGDFDQAMEAANTVLREESEVAQALLLRGVAKAGQGEHQDALADFDKARDRGLNSPALWQSRAISLQALGQLEAATESFSKAISLDQNFAPAYLKRGLLKARAEKLEEAISDFSKFIELKPNSPLGYRNRAVALIKLGRHADAKPDMIRAQKFK